MKARLLSPAGFLLALLCLFLPFAAVSCNGPSGKLSATYTGTDLLLNGSPTVTKSGTFLDADNTYTQLLADPPSTGVTWLMWIFVVVTLVGLATGFMAVTRNRLVLTSGIALLAALLLMVTVRLAMSNLQDSLFASQPDGAQALTVDQVGELTHTRPGYWAAFFLLIAVAIAPPIVAFFASRSVAAAKAREDAELRYGVGPAGPPHSGPAGPPSVPAPEHQPEPGSGRPGPPESS